ncbi:MAG: ribosome silencing factor [Elusimicrobia bacterium]|nr:ribosome silencing factor [Elusimicrobiota bacterium]
MIQKAKFRKLALFSAEIADSKKALDIQTYDAGSKSTLFYYAVVMSVESGPQMEAVEEAVEAGFKKSGIYPLHRDGVQSKNWKILDYGGLIIHVFAPQTREFYGLDRMYFEYKKIEWGRKAEKTSRKLPGKKAGSRKT